MLDALIWAIGSVVICGICFGAGMLVGRVWLRTASVSAGESTLVNIQLSAFGGIMMCSADVDIDMLEAIAAGLGYELREAVSVSRH